MAKIVFETKELQNAFTRIGAAIGDGKTNPATKNIYFEPSENGVLIKAGNMYLRAQMFVECKHLDTFTEFAVEGKSFAAFIKKLAEDEVTVIITDKAVQIKTVRANIKLPTINDRGDKMETDSFGLVAKIKNFCIQKQLLEKSYAQSY